MKKVKVTSAPVAAKIEAKGDAEFLSFYNKAAREKETPLFRVADAVTGICGVEVQLERLTKNWDKATEKAEASYIKISIKKLVDGEFVEVKELLVGHNDEHNTKWVMVIPTEVDVPKSKPINC